MSAATDHLIQSLYRTEYRKIVSVLCRRFGLQQIEVAEDLASDTFLIAARTWKEKSVPLHPVPWLLHVAKNLARNYLHRAGLFGLKVLPSLDQETWLPAEAEIDLSPGNINDSQLQMMFAVCHPAIPVTAQIGLSLRILCGFNVEEIAEAFLTNTETITKRLSRAKARLRESGFRLEFPEESEIEVRLSSVLSAIYLLFNEGYSSACNNAVLRKELCMEAIRLCSMLAENSRTGRPEVFALLSLMHFHASRFDARMAEPGQLILYDQQDVALWDADLISKGNYYLRCSAAGTKVSRYHLEAGIGWWHTQQADTLEKWGHIWILYQRLLQQEYSPVAALNAVFALSKWKGKQLAIAEAAKLKMNGNLQYHILMGYLYSEDDWSQAAHHYRQAIAMARTDATRQLLQQKLSKSGGE
ncbi:RNA polymerase subunit sigma [Pseudoflavitalea sp. G-6-1-2]|uniref:RNA polymerase sigma factor n=1 Tax=Pseudoflavitalea sp. G-6-1-2 TaxID=2728841 RepID=UPI00146E0619|nr:DUF6596 domain-containing protein [Pseudoflavitalea sp. G-6-1-2]NML21160.1 RNA polymerase subunit sigma [Pseudoflavitalea sp. G-6-1-2]